MFRVDAVLGDKCLFHQLVNHGKVLIPGNIAQCAVELVVRFQVVLQLPLFCTGLQSVHDLCHPVDILLGTIGAGQSHIAMLKQPPEVAHFILFPNGQQQLGTLCQQIVQGIVLNIGAVSHSNFDQPQRRKPLDGGSCRQATDAKAGSQLCL